MTGSEYIDFAFRQPIDRLRQAKADGVEGVIRYCDGGRVRNAQGVPVKQAEPAELADLAVVGLPFHSVFETSGGANILGFPQDGDYFTYQQGGQDWREYVAWARRVGIPTTLPDGHPTPMPLSVDRTMPPNDPRLRAYFQGAIDEDVLLEGSGYGVSIYARLADCLFIADTFGLQNIFPWDRRELADSPCDPRVYAHQYLNSQTVAGIPVDRDHVWREGITLGGSLDMANLDPQQAEQVKAIWREMAQSDEGAALVAAAIVHPGGYGQALELELQGLRAQVIAAGQPVDEAKILQDAVANIIARLQKP